MNELLTWTYQRLNMFQLMKKYDQDVSASSVEVHSSLSHQWLCLDHKKETNAIHSLSPESSELLHLEHLEILKFSYKTNHELELFKDKVHNHKKIKH